MISNLNEKKTHLGSLKLRSGPSGIHFFNRTSGLNVLIDDVVPPEATWAPAPRQVSVALTNTCDLACSYCYAPKTHATLAFNSVVSWLDELDANGAIGVGFGGGEPTLYRHFADICAHTAQNTGLAVTFTTHGHHLDSALLARLKGNVNFIRVSMDGIGAILYTIVECCRRRGLDPYAYLLHVLTRLPSSTNWQIKDLTPQAWAQQPQSQRQAA